MGIGRVLDEAARLREELLLRDAMLACRDRDLAAHQVVVDRQAAELAARDAELAARDAELAARDAELAARDAELAARTAEIAARDAEIARQTAELADQKGRLQAVVESNERLARQIALIEAARVRRNERFEVDPAQLPFPTVQAPVPPEPVEDDGETPDKGDLPGRRKKKRRKNKGRREPSASLPRQPVHHSVPLELRPCVVCNMPMPDGEPKTSFRYEWEPGHWKVLEVTQETCCCPKHPAESAVVADHGFALSESIAGNGMVARILTDKFADNIPLAALRDQRHGSGPLVARPMARVVVIGCC